MSTALPAIRSRPDTAGAVRRLRNGTGLVLAAFVTAHFLNHALGVFSIEAQQALLNVLRPIWQSPLGTLTLYSALLTHAALGLYALWRRRTLRMPRWELAQLVLGLAIPLLLIPHVFGTRVAQSILGTEPSYRSVVSGIWNNPIALVRHPALVVIVWTHLAIGLHFWLRLRRWYRKALPILYPIAIVVPVLALLGLFGTGVRLAAEPRAQTVFADTYASPADGANVDPEAKARLAAHENQAYALYVALLGFV